MKTAVIVGSEGQDGKIAFESLGQQGYSLIGLDRGKIRTEKNPWEREVDITNEKHVAALVQEVRPDEVYFFAAFHHSSQDAPLAEGELFQKSYMVNFFPYLHFLEAIRKYSPATKIFYAASSLIFGQTEEEEQDEETPFRPDTPYGITKLDGLLAGRYYRAKHGLFACAGIFYNHESEYRSEKFLSMKVVAGAVAVAQGKQKEVTVGDLAAAVDWGYARDYIAAAESMLRADVADDYIVASGVTHTVADWAKEAFGCLGLDWQKYVREDTKILTRRRGVMRGNARKLREKTGWQPAVNFPEMVKRMVESRKTSGL